MRRRARAARVALLLAVGLGAVALAQLAFRDPENVVSAAVRDYLAPRRAAQHAAALRAAAAESGVDPYLLGGLMVAESSGRVDARSGKGALGLFQLMPVTARWRAEELGLPAPTEEALLSDALLNARLGANNLRWLLDTYDGDEERALVAYNLGTGALARQVREIGGWPAWRTRAQAAGDSELLAFAQRVLRYRDLFREQGVLEPE